VVELVECRVVYIMFPLEEEVLVAIEVVHLLVAHKVFLSLLEQVVSVVVHLMVILEVFGVQHILVMVEEVVLLETILLLEVH
jgi:hypothetical protein